MNLSGIIAISGKPGLFKVVAQGKNNIIVQALGDTKKVPAYASDRISALEDISIYTYDEDQPLKEIFKSIYEKENGGPAISHKEDAAKQKEYLETILPNFDQERVYPSDIKKIFQWYNLIQANNAFVLEEETVEENTVTTEEKADKAEKPKKEKAEKKAVAPKAAKAPKAPATPKATASKKVAAPKTGSSRGK